MTRDMETQKRPGLTAAAVLILALGFGALGAALGVGKAVLWDDLPYQDAERLVVLNGIFEEKGEVQPWAIGHLDFLDWRKQNQAFEPMSVFTLNGGVAFHFQNGKDLERIDGELVSYTYFDTLGIQPSAGRFFTAEEDGTPFAHSVVVVSHDLWRSRLGGDKGIVGKTVNLNGKEWTVVGVGPEGFRGVTDKAQAWIPSAMAPAPEYVEVRRMRWLNGIARLKPGVSVEEAQQEMNRVTAALAQQYPDQNRGIGVTVQPLREFLYGATLPRSVRLVLLGSIALLLLACIDAAGLLRLGAEPGTSQIGRAVGLSVVAALLGVALATWAVHSLLPTSGTAAIVLPSFARLTPGPAVIAGLLALAAVSGLIVGLLSGGSKPSGGWRLVQSAAAVVQVALALGLLAGAGLMAKGFRQAVSQELGFKPEGVLSMRIDLEGPKYADDKQVGQIAGQYLRRFAQLPEVETAALTGPTTVTDDWAGAFVTKEFGDNPESLDGTYRVLTHGVSADYFKVMGVPILAGRPFNMNDTQGFPVILSKSLADRLYPGESPLGKRIKFSARKVQPRPWLTIVGVAADIQYQGYLKDERPAPDLYLSVLQQPVRLPMTLIVLAHGKPGVSEEKLAEALKRGILDVTSDRPPFDVATLAVRLDRQTEKARFQIRLASIFAGIALLLALAGVYGAVAGSGAGRGAVLAGIGVGLGLVALFVLRPKLAGLLFGGSAADPMILGGVAVVVLVLALAASSLGSRGRGSLRPA